MEHIAAFMLLVGCNGDATSCNEIPVPLPIYETAEECTRQLPLQMRLSGSTDTRVLGACKTVDPETLEQSASLHWAVTRDGGLAVEFDGEPSLVASR